MDLDDDRGVAPRQLPPRERGERLVRALGEDRVRRPVPQLARDADGERAVEQRAVEGTRVPRWSAKVPSPPEPSRGAEARTRRASLSSSTANFRSSDPFNGSR